MPAQIGQFCGVVWVGVIPDRGSCAHGGGRFPAAHRKNGLRPDHTAIQYRRGTPRTGELDGAKEADGG